ncbi:MAG: hypothetical protein ABEH81_01185 [Halopenitus sp.]
MNEMKAYDTLSDRQKGLINAIAINDIDDKELTNEEIIEFAVEEFGIAPYAHESTVSKYRREHEEFIEERKKVIPNERGEEGGEIVTTGDPMRGYEGPPEGIDATEQYVNERPRQNVSREEQEEGEPLFLLPIDKERAFSLLRSDDEETARWIFEAMIGDQHEE